MRTQLLGSSAPFLTTLLLACCASAATVGSAFAAAPDTGSLTACAPDLSAYCSGIEAGNGKKVRCLTENQAKLSAPCAASVQSHTAGTRMAQAAAPAAPKAATPSGAAAVPNKSGHISMRTCRADVAALCGPGDHPRADRVKCLTENRAKISTGCATTLSLIETEKENARAACRDDAAKLCGDAKGAAARQQCLETHKSEISPLCAARMVKRAAKAKNAAAPGATPPPTAPKQ